MTTLTGLRAVLLAVLAIGSLTLAPHARAASVNLGSYSYKGFAAYGSGSGTLLPPYPIGVRDEELLSSIQSAERTCALTGYDACNLVAWHRSSGTCSGETVTAPCYNLTLYGYSKTQTHPVAKEEQQKGDDYTIWYAITDITVSLAAKPAAIDAGGSSTLTWSVYNEDEDADTACSIDNGVGKVSAAGGSKNVSPAKTTVYTITCTDGASDDPDKATAQATVTVNGAQGGPDLTADSVTSAPPAPPAGVPATLTGVVHNTGDASTGAKFSDLFEIYQGAEPPARFSDLTDVKAAGPNAALAAGKSVTDAVGYTFPNAGTWWVRLCANTDTAGNTPGSSYGGTAESNYDNNCSASWTELSVGETSHAPDLVASSALSTPAAPVVGRPANLSGTVSNAGTDASATANDLFEIYQGAEPPARFSDLTATRSFDESAPLASGGQSADTVSYIFPVAGSWWVRLCANTDTAGNTPPAGGAGVQNESSYDNNCSASWTALTVFESPTPSVSCLGNGAGLSVDWIASATGFDGTPSFSWKDTAGNTGAGNPWDVSYATRSDYGAQVTAATQDQKATSVECFADISCKAGAPPTIAANPTRVAQGGQTALSWAVSSVADSCRVTGSDGYDSGTLASDGQTCGLDKTGDTDTVNQQTKYCIVCDGGAPVCVTVNVVPGYIEF
ncbi:MAG TPA: hypothetical protein VHC68_00145 [Candidatus Paceibacterota bacterium]|nr:hypothetical protein [Candidatus Paceibacterota bacterium]